MTRRQRHYRENKKKVRAQNLAWRKANPERVKLIGRRWYKANKKKLSAQRLARRKANPERYRAAARRWEKKNPERCIAGLLRRKYGIDLKEYKNMLCHQNNACAICKTRFSRVLGPNIDHCHKTGKVRGILCAHCNRGLGSFKDSTKSLHKAASYLKESRCQK